MTLGLAVAFRLTKARRSTLTDARLRNQLTTFFLGTLVSLCGLGGIIQARKRHKDKHLGFTPSTSETRGREFESPQPRQLFEQYEYDEIDLLSSDYPSGIFAPTGLHGRHSRKTKID